MLLKTFKIGQLLYEVPYGILRVNLFHEHSTLEHKLTIFRNVLKSGPFKLETIVLKNNQFVITAKMAVFTNDAIIEHF
jgi:hypothetical protein